MYEHFYSDTFNGHFYSLFKHIKVLLMHLVVLEAVGRQEVQKVEKFF